MAFAGSILHKNYVAGAKLSGFTQTCSNFNFPIKQNYELFCRVIMKVPFIICFIFPELQRFYRETFR